MTLTELLKEYPLLMPTKSGDKVYIIPDGSFGATFFPTGSYNDAGNFIPFETVVEVTPDQFIALNNKEYCWKNNELVPFIKPIELVQAEDLIKVYEYLDTQESEARELLSKYDYIASKVARAVLLNNSDLLAQYRKEYADVLINLNEASETINKVSEQRIQLKDAYEKAKELVKNTYSK